MRLMSLLSRGPRPFSPFINGGWTAMTRNTLIRLTSWKSETVGNGSKTARKRSAADQAAEAVPNGRADKGKSNGMRLSHLTRIC